MTQGRPKGNKAEIEIARRLEPWWSPLEPGCKFVRTPLSGGWGGKEVRAGFKASGDLMTTAKKFPFVVEVKRREGWAWKPLLDGKRSPVWSWWLQACKAAAEQGGCPLLVFRKNREAWHCLVPVSTYVRAPGACIGGPIRAWYAYRLAGRAGSVIPICISFDHLLAHEPEAWVEAWSKSVADFVVVP